jgi:hypothetical protein
VAGPLDSDAQTGVGGIAHSDGYVGCMFRDDGNDWRLDGGQVPASDGGAVVGIFGSEDAPADLSAELVQRIKRWGGTVGHE